MILTIRTDSGEAELGVYAAGGKQVHAHKWLAERRLAKELLGVLVAQLHEAGTDFSKLTGIVVYQGPGSFTGLRIGMTTANTIAYSQNIPVVGTQGDNWLQDGLVKLREGQNDRLVLPVYGGEANISTPRK
jgi:tRNA threonylcarbamoyladenosine biosynthesis protein TsaB